ncbi:bifunctional protein HldE [Alphaproteobacteria bacterium]|nr:bifunctional protein HldE [Alphaproteobacteria bacterium]
MTVKYAELASFVASLKGLSVLSIGDAMLDRFVQGTVDRISPEAPIPVLLANRETIMPGGAGNVARNLAALGARVPFIAVVGDDDAGHDISELVALQPEIDPVLVVEPGRKTTTKNRFFAGSQQLLRVDRESRQSVGEATQTQILEATDSFLSEAKAAVISDYGKGMLPPDLLARLIGKMKERGIPVVVDPKGSDYSLYRGATLVTPNLRELREATGMDAQSDEEIVAAGRRLIEKSGVENILVTRSKDGMSLIAASGAVLHIPTEAQDVFDVSGAGDTVAATLAAALAAGAPLDAAVRLSNIAAGIVVGKVGTAVVRPSELVSALFHHDALETDAKLSDLEGAAERIEAQRRMGKTIGFANGCFDLLHPGHISLLSQARSRCDFLVVGLNSDASVQRLKGPARPVQNQISRAMVLGALSFVDAVVVFDDDTPLETIRRLRPDLLVKGADYAEDQVIGGDLVKSWGGSVFLAQLLEGQSTTQTIQRMKPDGL